MEDLKPIIAKNITSLRQGAKMTQIELAERLNYSDKAISKWERAESLPDITVLKAIADLFGVPLDYLVRQEHDAPIQAEPQPEKKPFQPNKKKNHAVITTLSILIVWFVATLVYVLIDLSVKSARAHWICFLYAIPVTMIVWLVFNSIWFNRRRNYLIISLLIWSTLLAVVLTLVAFRVAAWQLFLLGIPGQVAVLLWSALQYRERK